ncbi:hypothetical protein Dimus_024885, partial [Dionaea muscipula]
LTHDLGIGDTGVVSLATGATAVGRRLRSEALALLIHWLLGIRVLAKDRLRVLIASLFDVER